MKKLILSAFLPFAALTSLAHAAPLPTPAFPPPTIVTSGENAVTENALYTESNWERILLPPEALQKLGNLRAVRLSVNHLPSNVHVVLSLKPGPADTVGLWLWRSDLTQSVNQKGLFTLTNPLNQQSYTFDATVIGTGR